MEESESNRCALCRKEFGEEEIPVSIQEKGLQTLVRVSKEREEVNLHQ